MGTVLVIEDSRLMQRTLQRLFESDALEVRIAGDGIAALEMFRQQPPDVVILDLALPGLSGKEVCRVLKIHMPSLPIVIVSANTNIKNKVFLFEVGADDYITKPFSPKELLARVRRVMRRTEASPRSTSSIMPNKVNHEVFGFGDVHVDFTSMKATRGGTRIRVTTQEFKLLKFLARSPERVFTRSELLQDVWGYNSYPSTRTVDNHILRLRQKFEPDPASPRYFLTMHGTGYMFMPAGNSE